MHAYHRRGSPFIWAIQKEGKVLYMRDSVNEWVHLAMDDIRQARYLLAGGFFRGACYSARQALEKGVSAELLNRGWELGKIHNILILLNLFETYKISVQCDDPDMEFTDSIHGGRYPAEEGMLPLKAPNREDAQRALGIVENIFPQLKVFANAAPDPG
jgi:HEPN domain-containing protein